MIYRLLIIAVILSGCRTLQKSSASTQSASDKSEQSSSKFQREVITEYLTDTLWRTRFDTLYRTVAVPNYHVVEKPVIVRQTIRESGEQQQIKAEKETVSEQVKEKEASIPMMLQYSALIFAIAMLGLVVIVIIKQFK